MAVAELGTASNHAADSCRVYNYYVGVANAGACSESSWPTGSNNNGNVAGYYYTSVNSGLNHAAAYNYDGVNRLASATATGSSNYSQSFSYDIYGNLNCAPAGPGCVALTYNAATNRITTSGYNYDAAGNLLNDGTHTYQWDAESHLTAVYLSANGSLVSLNTYNALGQRMEDVTQTSTTDEAYGAGGNLLLRYTGDSNSRSFVPFGGGILAEYYCGGMIFDHPDEIGSLTTATDCTGNTVNEKLFYPFGESWTGALIPSLGAHQTFAQLPDYDAETDQYNTLARHYSPTGRWLSPDPGGLKVVRLDDPQTWNMYAYARNNPTTMSDPSGLEAPVEPEGGGDPTAHYKLNLQDRVQCGNQYCPPQAQGDQTKTAPDTTPQEQQAQQQSQNNSGETLKAKPVNGAPKGTSEIQWQLSKKSKAGGYIVQEITTTDKSGKQTYDYWEAWQVSKGSKGTIYKDQGYTYDDMFRDPSGTTVNGNARFYEGLQLPSSFMPHSPGTIAGDLPATSINPNLPTTNATAPVVRVWTAP